MVTPNSRVRLLFNVPLNNSYGHQMDFADQTAQYTYFNSLVNHDLGEDFKYQRSDGSLKIDLEYDSVYDCNYLMFQNTNYTNKWFYAFITDKEYINPNTTRIYFEIDVWQTWQFDINFKSSFVEREHCVRWDSAGNPIVNTLDEGLNYGTDYAVKKIDKFVPFTDTYFLVIVSKVPMHDSAPVDSSGNKVVVSSLNGAPQPLSYYVHPFRMDDTVPSVKIDDARVSVDRILDVLNTLYLNSEAVNNIVSLYVTNYFGLPSNDATTLSFMSQNVTSVAISDGSSNTVNTLHVEDLSSYQSLSIQMGGKYDGFDTVTESKLQMYPYCVIQLTDFRGNSIDLKPQYIYDTNLILKVKGSLGTGNKVVYQINEYNTFTLDSNDSDLVAIENSLVDNNANDVPILSDYLSAYLQGNKNQLNNEKNSILFNGVTKTVGSVMAGVGMATARNPVGVVDAGMNAISAPVNAMFEIKGLQAKLQDISNVPPSIVKMGSNTAFDYGNSYNGVYIVKKQITPEYQKKLTDFFNMFGYKINEVKIPNMKTRKYWNYVKTVGAFITGNIPTSELGKIREMFNAGVTLWHTSDVGNYSLSNDEVS